MPAPGALASATLPARQARMQSRHPDQGVSPEHLGVEEQLVDPTVDDVHALEAPHGAHVDGVVVEHDQVAALDQLDARVCWARKACSK